MRPDSDGQGKRRGLPKILRGGFADSVAKVAGGTVAAQAIGVAVMPIVARLFPPDAFGLLASYSALLMLSLTICGFRYELAVPLVKEKPNYDG